MKGVAQSAWRALALGVTLFAVEAAAQEPGQLRTDLPQATARRVTGIIRIDGRLDEPDWDSTPSIAPNVSWQNLEQYDNESGLLSFQSRFRWILRPGNDLFLVVNRGWVKTFDDRFQSTFDRTSSKLQYTFRF